MADTADVQRIASALPEAVADGVDPRGFSVNDRGFCWTYPERVDPKKPRVANPDVLVVMVPHLDIKDALLGSHPEAMFTTDHYNGHRSVLVRLPLVDADLLEELLIDGHAYIKAMPPKRKRVRKA